MTGPGARVLHLEDFRAARAAGGWHSEPQVCTVCGHRQAAVMPVGTPGPTACGSCGAMACVLDIGPDDGPAQPDPHARHRAHLIGLLQQTLRDVQAGHVDAGFFVVHHSPQHPTGTGWCTAFSGNVDFVHRLGALRLAELDIVARANAPDPDPDDLPPAP